MLKLACLFEVKRVMSFGRLQISLCPFHKFNITAFAIDAPHLCGE